MSVPIRPATPRLVQIRHRLRTRLLTSGMHLRAGLARAGEPMHVLPVLLGLAIGWQWRGAARVLAPALEPSPWAGSALGIVLLLCLAIGPHLPEWAAGPLSALGRTRELALGLWGMRPAHDTDRARITAVFCGAAGILCLVQLALAASCLRVHELLLHHFFWTRLTLVLLNAIGLTLLLGAAWSMQGLLIVMLTGARSWSAASTGGPWSPSGQTLLGFMLAWGTATWWLGGGMSGHQLYLIGALPLFVMSVVCVGLRRPPLGRPAEAADLSDAPDLPGADAWASVGSLLAWAMAAVFVIQGLLAGGRAQATGHVEPLCWVLLGTGVGCLGRLRGGDRRSPHSGAPASDRADAVPASLSDAGFLLWMCGLLCTGVLLFEMWHRPHGLSLLIAGWALGHALHRLEQASLARLGRERLACAQLATTVCAGAAAGLAVAHWWGLPLLGGAGLTMLGVLTLFGAAGILQIYTQDRPGHVRHARLALVFVTLAGAIVIFPGQARESLQRRRAAAGAPARGPVDLWLAGRLAQARSVCWLEPGSSADNGPGDEPSGVFIRSAGGRDLPFSSSAVIDLLSSGRRFELLYQGWAEAGGHYPQYSVEWFRRLYHAVQPEGRLVIDVPRRGLSRPALDVVAATFLTACGGQALAADVTGPMGESLRLTAPITSRGERPTEQMAGWTPLVQEEGFGVPIHSLSRDQITLRLERRTAGAPLVLGARP